MYIRAFRTIMMNNPDHKIDPTMLHDSQRIWHKLGYCREAYLPNFSAIPLAGHRA